MKVDIHDEGLIIVPETEFEKDYIQHTFPKGSTYKAFVKCGLDVTHVIGLKVVPESDVGKA